MKKFIFTYHTDKWEKISGEEKREHMNKWMTWFSSFKDKMVDGGNPLAPGAKAVTAKGVKVISAAESPATGYSIINAKDMDEAVKIAKECPALEDEGVVRVFEALPM